MNILNRMMKPIAKRMLSLADLDEAMDQLIYGAPAMAGVNVSEYTALTYSALWACVNRLADGVALPPLHLYRRLDQGKERATDHPLYKLLHDAPNPMMTSYTWRRTIQGHISTWGNGYNFIEWGNDGQIKYLWPLNPAAVTPKRKGNELTYDIKDSKGNTKTYYKEQIFHIPGFGFDGIQGYSVVSKAREAIGLGLATEKYGAAFFGNGAMPGIVLEHPLQMSPAAHERLKKSWNEAHQGADNAHKLTILEEGIKASKLSIPPEDAQFLETRKFSIEEMARWFNIPLMLLQAGGETPTFASAEQFMLSYKIFTLMPHHENWEQSIWQQLLMEDEQDELFAEFLMDGLLRGDSTARGTFYTQMLNLGVFSPNDIRELENLNPVDGGDNRYIQLNMVPINKEDESTTTPDGETMGSPKSGDTAENIAEGEKLNGIQIQAGLTVINQFIAGQIPHTVAVELLVAVGIDRERATAMIAEASKFKPKEQPAEEPISIKQDGQRSTPNRKQKAENKRIVVNSYRSVMEDSASRLVKRQIQDITRALKKDELEFKIWLDEYYKKQPEVMRQIMTPAFLGLGESVQKCAAEECGGKVGMTPELTQCMNTHIELTSKWNSDQAYGRLKKVMGQAEGTRSVESWDKLRQFLQEELGVWESKIPAMIANWELTRTSGMMSKATYYFSGVKEMEWVSFDVELCNELDGMAKNLGADCRTNPFVPKNRALSSVCEHRALKDFTPAWNVYTPPLYNGCTCQILPKL